MRRLRRAAVDALLLAALGILTASIPFTVGAFSAMTASASSFTNLTVSPVTLDPAAVSGGTVHMTWSASATAASETVTYGVLRRAGTGTYSQIASVGGLTYDDAPGDERGELSERDVGRRRDLDDDHRADAQREVLLLPDHERRSGQPERREQRREREGEIGASGPVARAATRGGHTRALPRRR